MPRLPLLLSVATLMLVAACGSTEERPSTPPATATPAPDPKPTPTPEVQPAPAPTAEPAQGALDLEPLIKHSSWIHTYEEDGGAGGQVFRPDVGQELPPSRFRMSYFFAKDGSCKWLYLAPNDAHHMKDARCEINAHTGEVRFMDGTEVAHRFKILSIEADRMVIER